MDADLGNKLAQVAENFAKQGLRVLGMAYKEVDGSTTKISQADVESGLIFAGIQGMIDPPRQEVLEAIKECKHSGIRTVMITGDHGITAGAVAGQIGIGSGSEQVLEGRQEFKYLTVEENLRVGTATRWGKEPFRCSRGGTARRSTTCRLAGRST